MPDNHDNENTVLHIEGDIVDESPPSAAIVPATEQRTVTVHTPDAPPAPPVAPIRYGVVPITDEESQALTKPLDPQTVEIRPDGLLYWPGNEYRALLNRVIGAGQWALKFIEQGKLSRKYDEVFWYRGELWIRGEFVSEAVGEQAYKSSNPNSSWATAREGAKTDCLTRCCKDLGIANELWNPSYTEEWKKQNAVGAWFVDKSLNKKWFYFKKGRRMYVSGYRLEKE